MTAKLNVVKEWLLKHWKWVTGSLTLLVVYLLGVSKNSGKLKREKQKSELHETDADLIKKTKDETIESIEGTIEAHNKKENAFEKEKISRVESAEEKASELQEELNNNHDKLDKILKEKHGLTKL